MTVSTAEVLLEVMQADNRSVQALVSRRRKRRNAMFAGPTLAGLASGPVLYFLIKNVLETKDEGEKVLKEVEESVTETTVDEESWGSRISSFFKEMFQTEAPSTSEALEPNREDTTKITRLEDKGVSPALSVDKSLATPTEQIDNILRKVAATKNVQYSMLYALAGSESSFRPGVKASTSNAVGLFQFIPRTWKWLVKDVFPELGYSLQDREDPEKAATVAAMYLGRLIRTLKTALGKEPSIGEVYLAYFLGSTGAIKFIRAMNKDPNASAASMFPRAAQANKNIFYENGRELSLAEAFDKITGRVTSYYVAAQNRPTSSPQASVVTPAGSSLVSPPKGTVSPGIVTAKASPVQQQVSETELKLQALPRLPNLPQSVSESSIETGFLPSNKEKSQTQISEFIRDKNGRLLALPG